MNLDQILADWEREGVIDLDNPDQASAQTQPLHSKYIALLRAAKRILSRLEAESRQLYAIKWRYYTVGPLNNEEAVKLHEDWETMPNRGAKYIKQDLPMVLDGDKDIIMARRLRDEAQTAVTILEDIVKHINNRGFPISAIIEWRKFQAGQ